VNLLHVPSRHIPSRSVIQPSFPSPEARTVHGKKQINNSHQHSTKAPRKQKMMTNMMHTVLVVLTVCLHLGINFGFGHGRPSSENVDGGTTVTSNSSNNTSSTTTKNNKKKNDGHNIFDSQDSPIRPRIIGGTQTIPGRFPYHVSFLNSFGGHTCGGTLIAPDIVLTAAHCVDMIAAQVGRYDRLNFLEEYEEFRIKQEIRHPAYRDLYFSNDFMIVQLDGRSTFPTVTLNTDPNLPSTIDGQNAVTAAGFGVTEMYDDGSYNNPATLLQTVNLEAMTNEECNDSKDANSTEAVYQQGYQDLISPDMLCANGDGRDTCVGDSGGPLVIAGSSLTGEDDVQVGITSWGFQCGTDEFPGVYARVSHQYQWIRQTVCALSSSSSSVDAPPTSFECSDVDVPTPEPGDAPPPSTPARDVLITVIIRFDDYPFEVGWDLVDETAFGETVEQKLPGSYAGAPPQTTVYETFTVKEGSTYTFYMTDTANDGLCCDTPGMYMLVYGTDESTGEIITSREGEYGRYEFYEFTVPMLPDDATTYPTAAPTVPSTIGPTVDNPQDVVITVIIKMDDFSHETGWYLTDDTTTTVSAADGGGAKFAEKLPGSYADMSNGEVSYDTITVKESFTYSFHMIDALGDGLCCETPGWYLVVYGTNETGEVIASGQGYFGIHEITQFTVPTTLSEDNMTTVTTDPTTVATSAVPSSAPSLVPTSASPTATPVPTTSPSTSPTSSPTTAPSLLPSDSPSMSPSESQMPSQAPTIPSSAASNRPLTSRTTTTSWWTMCSIMSFMMTTSMMMMMMIP
jgi:trypsin